MQYIKSNKLIRFLLVGILNTLFGYTIFVVLGLIGMPYYLCSLLAMMLGILFNFKTIGKLVFKNHNNQLIFSFITVYSVIYLLNIGGLKLAEYLRISIYMAQAGLVFPLAIVSYILNKNFVFK